MDKLRFADVLHERPAPRGIDVVTKLQQFAIITYAVDPARLLPLIPPRFKLDTIIVEGEEAALLSVVPFIDVDFTSAVFPFPRFRCGQTNYRMYIIDQQTGERAVWFLGTVLDSWTLVVPRHLWRLPWYAGRIDFKNVVENGRGLQYQMRTVSQWASAEVHLVDSDAEEAVFPGFPDSESALVYLTHPLTAYYYRRDGKLGSYRVWHERLQMRPLQCIEARFDLLDRLGIIPFAEQRLPYNVMFQPETEFTIYLPPVLL